MGAGTRGELIGTRKHACAEPERHTHTARGQPIPPGGNWAEARAARACPRAGQRNPHHTHRYTHRLMNYRHNRALDLLIHDANTKPLIPQ